MSIKFDCEQCGRSISVSDALAGREGRCPTCRTPLRVPEGLDAQADNAQLTTAEPRSFWVVAHAPEGEPMHGVSYALEASSEDHARELLAAEGLILKSIREVRASKERNDPKIEGRILTLLVGIAVCGGIWIWCGTQLFFALIVFGAVLIAFGVIVGGIGVMANDPALMATSEWGTKNTAMICPHCQKKGGVRTKRVSRKKGISGGKATAAILTKGISILATGLSRKEQLTQAHCESCNNTWDF